MTEYDCAENVKKQSVVRTEVMCCGPPAQYFVFANQSKPRLDEGQLLVVKKYLSSYAAGCILNIMYTMKDGKNRKTFRSDIYLACSSSNLSLVQWSSESKWKFTIQTVGLI